jgi:hypothetical protein
VSFAGPDLRCFKFRAAGWVIGHVSFLGWAGISCLGSIQPMWAERKLAQASVALIFMRVLGNRTVFSLLGWTGINFWAEIS